MSKIVARLGASFEAKMEKSSPYDLVASILRKLLWHRANGIRFNMYVAPAALHSMYRFERLDLLECYLPTKKGAKVGKIITFAVFYWCKHGEVSCNFFQAFVKRCRWSRCGSVVVGCPTGVRREVGCWDNEPFSNHLSKYCNVVYWQLFLPEETHSKTHEQDAPVNWLYIMGVDNIVGSGEDGWLWLAIGCPTPNYLPDGKAEPSYRPYICSMISSSSSRPFTALLTWHLTTSFNYFWPVWLDLALCSSYSNQGCAQFVELLGCLDVRCPRRCFGNLAIADINTFGLGGA